ncbi:MAG TPA: lysylphosphatidylglycerol synthase transmembrane domain-containing protein [Polyangiaceae bacterium]|nr:lysylphosphatidylglycerol synthase transmembrane domain-containing protein [Polyangiaceae bacterium]
MNPIGEPPQPASTNASTPEPAPAPKRSNRGRNVRAAVVSVVLVVAFVWLLSSGGFPLFPPAAALAKLQMSGVFVFIALMLFNLLTRFARCHFLIAPLAKVPFRRMMTINAIGLAAITFLPLRIGEMARPAMLRDKGSLSAWAVTGTVGAERILDGIVFSAMLLVGLALAAPQVPLPDHVGDLPVPVWIVPRSATVASAVFVIAFLVMAAFYWFRALARRLTERVVGLVSKKLATRLADIVENLSEGLRFLTNWRYSLPYLAVTLISVASLPLGIEVLATAVGLPELSFSQSMVVLGVLALGFTVPNAPGFFGVVQLALYAGLATYIAPDKVAHEGSVLVFVYYAVYLGTVTLLAAIALVMELLMNPAPALERNHPAGVA